MGIPQLAAQESNHNTRNEAVTPKSKVGNQHTEGFSFLVHLGDEDLTQKLIPGEFIKHLNGLVPDDFIFKISSSSTGRCWFVKLQGVDKKLFFRRGWSQFVEDNSLQVGYSLVLEYKGNSQICVTIYGKNGGNKEVLSSGNNIEKQRNPGKKKEQEEKSKEKLTNTKCHIDLDDKIFRETMWGRDSVDCSVDNKKNCGSSKHNEPSRQKMAVSGGRTGIPEAECSYKSERPYFILTSTQKNEYEREIPEQFLREVEDEMPDVIFLKDHGARIWPVRLRKADGRVWFQEGWEQFIEYKSMTNPQFLVFKFDRKFQFDVSTLNTRDSSACEMEYSDAFQHQKELHLDKRSQFNEENRNKSAYGTQSRYQNKRSIGSMSSLEETPNPRYKKKRLDGYRWKLREGSDSDESIQSEQQSEESSSYEGSETTGQPNIQDEDTSEYSENEKQEEIDDEDYEESFDVDDSSSNSEVSSAAKKRAVSMKKKMKVYATEGASEYKSKHPSFEVILKPSYMGGYLPVPGKFCKRHLPEYLFGCMIRLEVSDGRKWLVKCLKSSTYRNECRLSKGFPKFLSDNNLVEGDACIFEAIKKIPDFVCKVHIIRQQDV